VHGDVPVVAGGLEPATYHNNANTQAPVLTISASGANAGYVNLWHIPVWSSDSSYIDASMTSEVYFWYVLLKKRQKEIFDAQTGSAQPHIYPQHIAVMPITEINSEDIKNFNNSVSPLFSMIGANIEENRNLASLRDTLLPKLMSGELDVSAIDL
jgi:type I restriction enzyme S subunit